MTERSIIFNGDMVRAILDGRKTQHRVPVKPQPDTLVMDVGRPWTFWLRDDGVMIGGYTEVNGTEFRGTIHKSPDGPYMTCPFGQPGDRLIVKEAHWIGQNAWGGLPKTQNPDNPDIWCFYREGFDRAFGGPWRPSTQMPRWASRLTLLVKDVRVERVQDISEADARAEGIEQITNIGPFRAIGWKDYGGGQGFMLHDSIKSYQTLWDSIYAKKGLGWDTNPWVWVIEFEVV